MAAKRQIAQQQEAIGAEMAPLPPSGTTLGPDQLIEACQGMVKSLAWKIHRKLPPHVELDDLIAYGQVGLAQAARDFDPSRGGQFTTYAYYRIRGAIFDGLAQMSWFSRRDYHASRYERMANAAMEMESEEPRAACRTTEGEVQWLAGVTGRLSVIYLATLERHGVAEDAESLVDRSAPQTQAIEHEMSEKLSQLIDALPAEARELIRATYFEGVTLTEAGRRLGISKAWASRLHAKTLQRLARALALLGAHE